MASSRFSLRTPLPYSFGLIILQKVQHPNALSIIERNIIAVDGGMVLGVLLLKDLLMARKRQRQRKIRSVLLQKNLSRSSSAFFFLSFSFVFIFDFRFRHLQKSSICIYKPYKLKIREGKMFSNSPFKENIFDGVTCLVTGGSSGIGFEIARQIGLHGANVVISGRRKSVLETSSEALAKDGISVHFVQGDVRSYADCERMVSGAEERFGGLNILINAAAGNFLVPAEKLSSNGMKTVLEIDTLGTFNMCRAAFRLLQRTIVPPKDGEIANDAKLRNTSESSHSKTSSSSLSCIVNVSATLHYGATWYQVHASAAKSAIDSMTRSLALEWGSYGIRVCGIAPGPIEGTIILLF